MDMLIGLQHLLLNSLKLDTKEEGARVSALRSLTGLQELVLRNAGQFSHDISATYLASALKAMTGSTKLAHSGIEVSQPYMCR
jgi:hypothetical protein